MTNQKFKKELNSLGAKAKEAKEFLLNSSVDTRNDALKFSCEEIHKNRSDLFKENEKDLVEAKKLDLQNSFIDRLELNEKRVDSMIDGLNKVINLNDPIGELEEMNPSPSGFKVSKMRVPLGTIGIIYESRPNVTADASALCIKSGNASILRGGSEAVRSNNHIVTQVRKGLTKANLPYDSVQLIQNQDRDLVKEFIKFDDCIDLIIPRGGSSLVRLIAAESKVPILKHFEGLCHVFVDSEADIELAKKVVSNAKSFRYGICGAMETLLVSEDIAQKFLPKIVNEFNVQGVEVRACSQTLSIVSANKAIEEDWSTEYLEPIISIKIVKGLDEAIKHINDYGSGHTDSIITENQDKKEKFFKLVDSSSVMHNLPTCYADGFEYGLGAEVGISTDKLHARGPVGLNGLTTQKFILEGRGQIRS